MFADRHLEPRFLKLRGAARQPSRPFAPAPGKPELREILTGNGASLFATSSHAFSPMTRVPWRLDGDIFGDGVNVAARLEGLAEPGGICVSARVQEDVAGRLDLTFEDLGEQSVKNIVRPIRAYALNADAIAALPSSAATNSANRAA
jgi:hypothetical protein